MKSLIIVPRTNLATNQDYFSQILTTWSIKLRLNVDSKFSHNKLILNQNITILNLWKMKHEMCGVVMEEFVSLKPNICSILASDSSKYKKAKGVNRNTVPKTSHNESKDVLLN